MQAQFMASISFVLHSEVSISLAHQKKEINPRLCQLWQVFYVRRRLFYVRN